MISEKVIVPRIQICSNCGKTVEKIKVRRCLPCYNYLYRTGKNRPKELWKKVIVCQNDNCGRPLVTDRNAKRFLCGACYAYHYIHKKDRPERLCKPSNSSGWCTKCGQQIILSDLEIENEFQTKFCFACRLKGYRCLVNFD